MSGVTDSVVETFTNVIPQLRSAGWKIVVAIFIIFVGISVARIIRHMLDKTFTRMKMDESLKRFLLSAIYVVIIGISIFIAADQLGISSATIFAILGSAALALSLSLQNVIENFAGGILLLVIKPFKIGDYIICGDYEGTVSSIGLVYTKLKTIDNKEVVLPNGTLSNSNLTNVTSQDKRRLDIKVGISYTSDIKKAKDILYEIYEEDPKVIKDEDITVFVDELGESSIILGVRGWVATDDYWQTKWDITEKIKLIFDERGIEIPYRKLDVKITDQR